MTPPMRQAVLAFDNETIAEWGFAAFLDAGIRDIEVLSCEGSRGVVRIHVEEQVDERRLDESDPIKWWEQVSNETSEHVYLIEGDASRTSRTTTNSEGRIPRTERVDVHEQGFTLTYSGPQERISDMVAGFEEVGINATLQQLREYRVQDEPLDTLTDRQREVLEVAFDNGYYDLPRSTSTKELATELDLDDSTVAEHLQRAERNIFTAVLGR